MSSTEKLCAKYFKTSEYPYFIYERKINSCIRKSDTLLDAGCGRKVTMLREYIGKVHSLIGVDLEDNLEEAPEIKYIKGNISSIDIPDKSVDIVISKTVLEHVPDPMLAFAEISRILKPSGNFIFLVPNIGDYISLMSCLSPHKLQKHIVSKLEGRKEQDIFPVYYKANSYSAIKKLSEHNGFEIVDFQWLGQYPAAFMFNSFLFLLATFYEKTICKFECLRFLRAWLLVHLKKI